MNSGFQWLLNTFKGNKSVQVQQAFADVFNVNNTNAQLVLQDLCLYCNFNSSSFVKNDPTATAFNEGARDVLLHILQLSNISTASLLKVQQQLQNNNYN